MTYANGHTPSVMTLFSSAPESNLETLSNALSTWNLESAPTIDEAWRLLQNHNPVAVIATDDQKEVRDFFQNVRQANQTAPLLVLIAKSPLPEAADCAADVVFPWASADQLESLLKPLIELRAENERLRAELKSKAPSSDEIDLLRNAIVRNVAHELRTPLLQVKSAVALLAEDAGDNTTLVELAMGATTRLEAGVKNITLLNELINESLEMRSFEPVVLRDIVELTTRNLRRSWEHKANVERIRVPHMPDSLPPVLGDKQRLAVALQLLVDNALKFSKDSVDIIFRRMGDEVHIAVRDYGIGIPQDKIDRIFESFYQVDSSTTKRYGGMGIGLSIVRFILDRHNTQVVVETEVDKGSTFAFSLPVAKPDERSLKS